MHLTQTPSPASTTDYCVATFGLRFGQHTHSGISTSKPDQCIFSPPGLNEAASLESENKTTLCMLQLCWPLVAYLLGRLC